eukprot:12415860-Karenia_brevis.AAC.1
MEGDIGVLVGRAQEEYVTDIGYGKVTYELGKQYAEWSATAAVTLALASRGDNTSSGIAKRIGYGQRAVFKLQ